jgi:hypothetical protein
MCVELEPAKSITGAMSCIAVAMPPTQLRRPGPFVTITGAIRPVERQ